jgi:hypothetical protein
VSRQSGLTVLSKHDLRFTEFMSMYTDRAARLEVCVMEICGHFCREKRHCGTIQQNFRVKTMRYFSDIAHIWGLEIRNVKFPLLKMSGMVLQSSSSSSSSSCTPVSSLF